MAINPVVVVVEPTAMNCVAMLSHPAVVVIVFAWLVSVHVGRTVSIAEGWSQDQIAVLVQSD